MNNFEISDVQNNFYWKEIERSMNKLTSVYRCEYLEFALTHLLASCSKKYENGLSDSDSDTSIMSTISSSSSMSSKHKPQKFEFPFQGELKLNSIKIDTINPPTLKLPLHAKKPKPKCKK